MVANTEVIAGGICVTVGFVHLLRILAFGSITHHSSAKINTIILGTTLPISEDI